MIGRPVALGVLAAVVASGPTHAAVTISTAATQNMTCSGGVCTPTATDTVLNVTDLEGLLASGNVEVTTTGSGIQASDIRVNARLTWSAETTIALDAFRSIEVNRKVTVAGTGGVSLTTNDGGTGGDFACNDNGRIAFVNASGTLTINGAAYMLVDSVASLASAVAANPSGNFALARDYDAKKDGTYVTSPVSGLGGLFNGLGNRISNVSINDSAGGYALGFFDFGSTIANIRLVDESVQGNTVYVGGLVGSGGQILHSFTSGTVGGGEYVGGLLGENSDIVGADSDIVTDSGSAAAVSGVDAGGLVGYGRGGVIRHSWATGNVSGDEEAGGLVADNGSTAIEHSWASGQVSGAIGGGLVGLQEAMVGSIERSYASGTVTCGGDCGGLVGQMQSGGYPSKIVQSFATGAVTTSGLAGGLVGNFYIGEIRNSYALGPASGSAAGGLIGQNYLTTEFGYKISSSYAAGVVTGADWAGGLIGTDVSDSSIRHTYWDMTTSGITNRSQGAGNIPDDPGIKGLSNRRLKSGLPNHFNPKIWAEDPNINNGLPYLIHNPPPK